MKYLILLYISFVSVFADGDYNATQNADDLGMYYQDYNSSMALTGILIGTLIMAGMIHLTIKIGGK